MPSPLCQFCQAITGAKLINGCYLGLTVKRLIGTQDICSLCQLIIEALTSERLEGEGTTIHEERCLEKEIYLNGDCRTSEHLWINLVNPKTTEEPALGVPRRQSSAYFAKTTPQASLRMFSSHNSTEAFEKTIACRALVPPNSNYGLERCRMWVKYCLENHPNCSMTLSGTKIDDLTLPEYVPKRIIDVGLSPGSTTRLISPDGLRERYVALSYCWGSESVHPSNLLFKATKDSIELLCNSISIEKLPKTIQDAILVTRALGIKYLWVDSLCILQDSVEDWQEQSKNMGKIFQNATCTIAATGSEHSETGLFIPRTTDLLVKADGTEVESYVRIPYTENGIYLGDLGVSKNAEFPGSEHEKFVKELEKSRWNHRAWVVQEILLSRRVIHFGRYGMYFECQSCFKSDSSLMQNDESEPLYSSKRAIFDRLVRETTLASRLASGSHELRTLHAATYLAFDKVKDMLGIGFGQDQGKLYEIEYRFWARVVRRYNITDLTVESDKMAAILGLAISLEARTNFTYCAGIWIEDVARHLFWCPEHDPLVRQPESGAPTWSWTAWKGHLKLGAFVSDYDTARPRVAEYTDVARSPSPNARSFIRLVAYTWKAKIETRGGDFRAWKGWIAADWWTPKGFEKEFINLLPHSAYLTELFPQRQKHHGMMRAVVYLDEVRSIPSPEDYRCIVLHSTMLSHDESSETGFGYYILVVRQSLAVEDAYERVGVGLCMSAVDMLSKSWMGHQAPTEKILLI